MSFWIGVVCGVLGSLGALAVLSAVICRPYDPFIVKDDPEDDDDTLTGSLPDKTT